MKSPAVLSSPPVSSIRPPPACQVTTGTGPGVRVEVAKSSTASDIEDP